MMPWIDGVHVTLGPEGHKASPEELSAAVAEMKEQSRLHHEQHIAAAKALEGLPYVAVPIEQMESIYERMLHLIRLGQSTPKQWASQSKEAAELKSAVFGHADFGAVFAGQWLPQENQSRIREKVKVARALADQRPEVK